MFTKKGWPEWHAKRSIFRREARRVRRVRSQQKRKHNEFYAKRLEKNRNAAPSARRWLRRAPRVKHEFYANRFEKKPKRSARRAAPAAQKKKKKEQQIIATICPKMCHDKTCPNKRDPKHIQNPPKKNPQNDPYSQRRPEGGPRGRQKETPKPSKTAPEEPPESIASNGQKKEAGTPGFDKAPGGSNVTFSTVFSLPEHPPVSPVLGPTATILGPDLVPVYMYIYIYTHIYIYQYVSCVKL